MNITLKQAELAKTLFQIEDNQLLNKIERLIKTAIQEAQKVEEPIVHYTSKKTKNGVDELIELAKYPTPEHISAEQLIEEQGFDMNAFNEALDDIDDSLFEDETLEELLNTLSK
jgi:hypothetical protein